MSHRTRKYIISVVIALLLSVSVSAESLPKVKPEKVGLSSERLAHVGELFQGFVDKQQLAGAVVLIAIAMSQLSPHNHLNMAGRFKLLVYQSVIE